MLSKTDCEICNYLNNEITNKNIKTASSPFISLFKWFIKNELVYFRKFKFSKSSSTIDMNCYQLLSLFYYSITHKTYKFLNLYHYLVTKKSSLNIIGDALLDFFRGADRLSKLKLHSQQSWLQNMLFLETMNQIGKFMSLPNELKYYSNIFHICKAIRKYSNYTINLLQNIKKKDEIGPKIVEDKKLNEVLKYNLMIHRFILETFLSKKVTQLPYFDIDMYEEFLHTQFNENNHLIVSVKLSKNRFVGKIERSRKQFILYQGELFSKIFPKKLRKKGKELFLKKNEKFVQKEEKFQYI